MKQQVGFLHQVFLLSNIFNIVYCFIEFISIVLLLFVGKITLLDNVKSWIGPIESRLGNYGDAWFILIVNIVVFIVLIKMLSEIKNLKDQISNGFILIDNPEYKYYSYFLICILISVLMVKSIIIVTSSGFIN